jgi:hypothetical protein
VSSSIAEEEHVVEGCVEVGFEGDKRPVGPVQALTVIRANEGLEVRSIGVCEIIKVRNICVH